jgi:hypothetical protein
MWQTKKLKGKNRRHFWLQRFDRSFYSVNKKSNVDLVKKKDLQVLSRV